MTIWDGRIILGQKKKVYYFSVDEEEEKEVRWQKGEKEIFFQWFFLIEKKYKNNLK